MKDKSQETPNKMIIKCACGEELTLNRVGGQYQDEYRKMCKCGREWVLIEISEMIAEIDDC
jgi:hypothetical protein